MKKDFLGLNPLKQVNDFHEYQLETITVLKRLSLNPLKQVNDFHSFGHYAKIEPCCSVRLNPLKQVNDFHQKLKNLRKKAQ